MKKIQELLSDFLNLIWEKDRIFTWTEIILLFGLLGFLATMLVIAVI
jgi:hypothetical protein